MKDLEGQLESLNLKDGDAVIIKSDQYIPSSVAAKLVKAVRKFTGVETLVIHLRTSETIATLDDERFAELAHKRGFYKAVPDHSA